MRILESVCPRFPHPQAWDEFVASDRRGHLLQTWAWGELKRAFGWVPIRLAVEQDGVLVAGTQVLYRKIGPLSIGYIPKGPVLVEETPRVTQALWQAVHARSRRMRAIMLKAEPEWSDEEQDRHQWLFENGLKPSRECIQPRRTVVVNLMGSEDEILARMKPKWRYNIRLSSRKGVKVVEGSEQNIAMFYELMRITSQRDSFGIHSMAYYRQAWERFAPLDRAKLYLAYKGDVPLAGLIAYAFNGQAWYMYGASSNLHRELMPNHQLQWRAMQWAKARGCTQYDLWGIRDIDPDSPSVKLGGVQRFKMGFGGQVVRYVGAYDYVYSPALVLAHGQAQSRSPLWMRCGEAEKPGS